MAKKKVKSYPVNPPLQELNALAREGAKNRLNKDYVISDETIDDETIDDETIDDETTEE